MLGVIKQRKEKMKKVDIKSFLIGVLITTNLFFFMGFSSTTETDVYDNDDIMREVKRIKSTVSSIESKVRSLRTKITSIEIYGVDCNE